MQLLIVQMPDGEHRVFDLYGEDVSIGRERARDMQLAHASVSREHARMTWGGGGYRIEDAGSHNGIYVNGQAVQGHQALGNGDLIRLGHFELIYIDGVVPKRFQKLDVPNIPRWYAVGIEMLDDSTAQVSTAVMRRLLEARKHLEGGTLVLADGSGFDLEGRVWVMGRGAEIDIASWFGSANQAELTWNGRNHVLSRKSRTSVRVNGLSVRSCTLEDGDCIAIGRSRFTYEVRM